jgi:hypothetical protein
MEECTEPALSMKLEHDTGAYAIFLYTPMCGTCKLAERMLDIIITMEPSLQIYKSNINLLAKFSQTWQVESMPCLLIMDKGELLRKIYAMRSVDDLYKILLPIMKKRV